jgi:hypothetical protein
MVFDCNHPHITRSFHADKADGGYWGAKLAGGIIGALRRVLVVRNCSSIDRKVTIADGGGGTIYFISKGNSITKEFTSNSASCWWIDDHCSGIHFDIYGGTSGLRDWHMTTDLHDHHVIHHGKISSHADIRNHGRLI